MHMVDRGESDTSVRALSILRVMFFYLRSYMLGTVSSELTGLSNPPPPPSFALALSI